MQTRSPEHIETQLRDLPALICEMQICGGSLQQIHRMLNCRCKAAADVISRLNHHQDQQSYQKIRRIISGGGGVNSRGAGR